MKTIWLSILFFFSTSILVGQISELSTLRQIKIPFQDPIVLLDSCPVLPYTVQLFQGARKIDSTLFEIKHQVYVQENVKNCQGRHKNARIYVHL